MYISVLLCLMLGVNLNASNYQVRLVSSESQASDITSSPTVEEDPIKTSVPLFKIGPCLSRQMSVQIIGKMDSSYRNTSTSSHRSQSPQTIGYVKTETQGDDVEKGLDGLKSQMNTHQTRCNVYQNNISYITKLINEYKTGLYTMESVQNQLIALQKRFEDHLQQVEEEQASNAVKMHQMILVLNQLENKHAEMKRLGDECSLNGYKEDVHSGRITLQKRFEQHLQHLQQEQKINIKKINDILSAVNQIGHLKPEITRSRAGYISKPTPQPKFPMSARTYSPQLPPTLTRGTNFNPAAPFISTTRRTILTHYLSAPDLTPRMM